MKDNKVTKVILDPTNKIWSETFSALFRNVLFLPYIFVISTPFYHMTSCYNEHEFCRLRGDHNMGIPTLPLQFLFVNVA